MPAHDFHIRNLQPLTPDHTRHLFKRRYIASRKNIFIQLAVSAFGVMIKPDRIDQRHKLFKIVICDSQAAIHIGLANGKIGFDQNTPELAVILSMNRYIGSG